MDFYSNGKLLLTGEYVLLDGAKGLALPTRFGQSLSVQPLGEPKLIWESYTNNKQRWLQVEFDLPKLRIVTETFDTANDGSHDSLARNLHTILVEAKKMNPDFLNGSNGFLVRSYLDFKRNWGLGSSSTLINNIAQWAAIDAFTLQFNTFGGSGYDIACAQKDYPIIYQLVDNNPHYTAVDFNPNFKEQLYFVYLNKKQNSREGIAAYQHKKRNIDKTITTVSTLTEQLSNCTSLPDFEKLLAAHETVISTLLHQQPIQQQLFSDYFGQTKSLGAWGGDFILATGNRDTPAYFKHKGFKTVIRYTDMILCNNK